MDVPAACSDVLRLQPLLKLNDARVPYFLNAIKRHAESAPDRALKILDAGCGAGLVTEQASLSTQRSS